MQNRGNVFLQEIEEKQMRISLLFFLIFLAGCEKPSMSLSKLVPSEIHGWKATGKDTYYDRKTLFNYIDGGAELYLTYNFQKVFVRRFTKASEPSIEVAVFDMNTSYDSYGIFTFEREDDDIAIGQGSEYASGLLRFWKNQYFVCIIADSDAPSVKKAVIDLGKSITKRIRSDGKIPEIISLLPKDNLVATSIRYFHSNDCLNRLYYVANQNIFNLDEKTEAVLARYSTDKPACHLLLIAYRNRESVEQSYKSFISAYLPEAPNGGPFQTENGKWTGAVTKGKYMAIVFDSDSKLAGEELLKKVLVNLEEKHTE